MIAGGRRFPVRSLLAIAAALLLTDRALGCAVCFGDPESGMAKGAVAGVIVMIGVVSSVLIGVAGTGLYWIQRGRRLARAEEAQQDSVDSRSDHDS